MRFEWDADKNCANQLKHGVAFEDASLVFADIAHLIRKDRVVEGEQRWLRSDARGRRWFW